VVDIGFVCSVCLSSESFLPLGLEMYCQIGLEWGLLLPDRYSWLNRVDEMVWDVAGFELMTSFL
jgi:hypothetical protein